MLEPILNALKIVAKSPFALIGYIIVVPLFLHYQHKKSNLKRIVKALKQVPEAKRDKLLISQFGIYLEKGVTADEYLKEKRQTFNFIIRIAIIVAVLILLSQIVFVVFGKGEAKANPSITSQPITIDYNRKNSFLAKYIAPGSAESGNIGLFLPYEITIKNNSAVPLTIRALLLEYKSHNVSFYVQPTVLLTGTLYEPQKHEIVPSLKVYSSDHIRTFRFFDWTNIRELFDPSKMLLPKGVIQGSACFVLPIINMQQLPNFGQINLVALDFSGDSAWFPFNLSEVPNFGAIGAVYHYDSVDRWDMKCKDYTPPSKDEYIKNRDQTYH